jgi:uncharacterized protein YegP (UPF0339 family)
MAAKFTLYKDKANQFRFNLKAANGEIIAAGSESYPDKKSALKGIASIQKNAPTAQIVDSTAEKAAPKKAAPKKAPAKKPAAKKEAPKKEAPKPEPPCCQ